MKAYLFIETGEMKKPKDGEWYYDNNDHSITQSDRDFKFVDAPILTRHEIEIPDGATEIGYTFKTPLCGAKFIPTPRPKKKVKKWRWVIATKKGKDVGTTTHMTESELHRIYPNQKWYHRIDETEIEVEE